METGSIASLTREQRASLDEFRRLVGQTELDEFSLLRFLKARKFKIPDAQRMLTNHLKWRIDFGLEQIFTFAFPEFREIFEFYPHGHHKTDRSGRPIYIERLGLLNVKRLFEVTNSERMLRYFVREYERLVCVILPACSETAGYRVEQTFSILDLGGAGTRLMKKQVYNLIKLASNVAQENYPELLGRMFIVNAPLLFSGAWTIVKPMLDEKTRNKITIIGSKFQKQLFEIADPANIPAFLGGTCNCDGGCLFRNIGPWNPEGRPRNEFGFPEGTSFERRAEESKSEPQPRIELNALRDALSQGLQGGPRAPQSAQLVDTPVNTQVDDVDS
mmetsp:Transcript_9504/g.18387  ORF Transcript_9504/g.18387 Transcript_9504/m.18387 type:complete len:331 (+) Transcript_9504:995-1987(+)